MTDDFDPFGTPTETLLEDVGMVDANPHAIVSLCDQGSQAWFGVRLGIPTASHAELIVTPTGKAATGQGRQSYINGLVAERLTGSIEMQHDTPAMERGRNLEPQARAWYEFETGRKVVEVGFVYRDADKTAGASPDGLVVGECGGIEIKCLMRRAHVGALLAGAPPKEYRPQVQFCLWTTGAAWWDFVLFTPEPELPSRIWRVLPDETAQAVLDERVPAMVAEIDAAVAQLRGGEGD